MGTNTTSILNKLETAKVVGFDLYKTNKKLCVVTEVVDYYYSTTLTKQEMWNLIQELTALHDQMED